MKKIILVAGATGNLGGRIVKSLIEKNAEVRALERAETDPGKIRNLEALGIIVFKVNMQNTDEIAFACKEVDCVVSALAGLRDVIIGVQKNLLDGAINAGVPRFIPSDYSLDFTNFPDIENRNLNLRQEFHRYLDTKPIAATTIFNGAFAELLTDEMPLILFKQKLILYWGKSDHKMSFTTMDDTAEYTANAALDSSTPRYLRIAGDNVSPRDLKNIASEETGNKFRLLNAGGKTLLDLIIKIAKKIAPAKNDLYPAWQGMQYMRNMIDKRSDMKTLDNDRYPSMKWTSVSDVLTQFRFSINMFSSQK